MKRVRDTSKTDEKIDPKWVAKKLGADSNKLTLASDGTTIVITFSDGSVREVKKISADEVKNYELMGAGKFQDLFGAMHMGIRHYRGDFLRDVCAYRQIDDPADELFGGYEFYKEKKEGGK